MNISTALDCGSRAYCLMDGKVVVLTVGSVRVEHADSPGVNGGVVESALPHVQFDNYKPQFKHVEQYMCVETGIGSGRVWTLGENIFKTVEEAMSALESEEDRR